MHTFTKALLAWHPQHGRHDLPWQRKRTAYTVWLSEVMLQQTQVSTVIPYFHAFTARFPDVTALAAAREDDVMALWSGLGYYSRARNLHRSAQQIVAEHGGEFPQDFEALLALPGVGRSTAGAIMAQAFDAPFPILDGNVKRVLTRYFGVADPIGKAQTEKKLWALATSLTPNTKVASYTQAIMDLGATLCKRSTPECKRCPMNTGCVALNEFAPTDFPKRQKKSKKLPIKQAYFLLLHFEGQWLLEKRPAPGIWGGLWCPPQYEDSEALQDRLLLDFQLSSSYPQIQSLPTRTHIFSHYKLLFTPVIVTLQQLPHRICADTSNQTWYILEDALTMGLPAPIKTLLGELALQKIGVNDD